MDGATALRPDLAVIAARIAPGSRVLDVGCGDGALLASLRDAKGVDARGMEIDPALVAECVARGLSVVQGDAERDLADYPDAAFDYAVLGQTLQTAQRPDLLLGELLRVGRTAFVSFPNFAHWRTRMALLWHGRMPVTRALPMTWYETRNIHHVTIADFERLAQDRGLAIGGRWFFAGGKRLAGPGANWRAEFALYELATA
jgi:methionine biosynthesis protein MetW